MTGKRKTLSDLWGNTEQSNVCVIGVPVEEAKDNVAGTIFEETMKNTPRFVDVH